MLEVQDYIFNSRQMLTFVNMPVLLLWEVGGKRDEVGRIGVLAFLQQFQGQSLGGEKAAAFPHAEAGDR